VATVLTARALGPENYGILALVIVYELTVGKLVTFNAWQALIKYGSESLQADDRLAMRQLIKFCFCLDVSGAIAGVILAIALSGPIISWLGWNQAVRSLLVLYSVLILFRLSGTSIGVLRLFDRFDLLSFSAILNALIRIMGVTMCLLTKQGLYGFVLVYLITGLVDQLFLIIASLWVLHKQGVSNYVFCSLKGMHRTFPGIWDYIWTTNLNSTVRMFSREADELIVAGLTTPASLGLYKIAKQFSRALPMLIDPLYQSIYPELTKFWSAGKKKAFSSLIKRTTFLVSIVAFGGWLGFIILGKWLIVTTVGISYQNAYMVAVVYMLALVIALLSFSLQPSILAIGLPIISFKVLVLATSVYFVFLLSFVSWIGILGAAISYVIFYVVWSSILFVYLRRRHIYIN
ncbi:oligosaccharide flippase family protein, partial [bacterium]|nr:oligosaccharide flippase family protein [bacterium]